VTPVPFKNLFTIFQKKLVGFVLLNKHSINLQNNVLSTAIILNAEAINFITIKQEIVRKEEQLQCVLPQHLIGML